MSIRFQTAVRALILAAVYYVTGRLGLLFPAVGSHITLVWLPSGFAVAALLRCGFSCWPGVALGAAAVNLSMGVAWPAALGIGAGNTVGALAAAWILGRTGYHTAFDRRRDILLLFGAAVLGTLISASNGVAMLALAGALPGEWLAAWWIWWAGDTMGVIAAAPLVLAFSRGQWRAIVARRGEFLIWVCTTCLVVYGAFVLNRGLDGQPWPLAFLPLPLVAWAALRFGVVGTSLAIIMLSFGAAFGTMKGSGPFARISSFEEVTGLWLFMVTIALTGWLITAMHGARQTAGRIRRLLEDALSDVSLGVLLGDLDRKITFANAGFTRLTGYTEAELLGRSCSILQGPGTDPLVVKKIREALHGDGYFDGEILNYRKDGTPFWNALLISPVHDERGEKTGFLGIQRDVTKRRNAEEALTKSLEFTDSLIRSMQDGVTVIDLNGVLVEVNPAWCNMTGFSREELVGSRAPYPYWPPEEKERIHAALGRTLEGRFENYELTYMRKTGERFPVIISPSGVKNKEGAFVNFVATIKDISERKRGEEALRLASQKLRLHFERTPMAVIEWDLEFRVTDWNPAAQTIFGFSRAEALGRHASFIVPEKFRDHVDGIWQALLKRTGGERSSNENVTKDARTILCEWYNTPLIDERGTVIGAASVVMDITERRHAQQLLAWEKSALELIDSPGSLRDVLDGLMCGLEKQAPGALCSVLLLDADGIHLRHGAGPSLPEDYNRAIDGVAIGPAVGSCGTAAYENRQVIVSDIGSDPLWADFRDLALKHGLHACWSTPIHCSKGKVLGTFAVYYREPRSPTAAELELIMRAAGVTSIAIERKRAEEEIHLLNADLERRVERRTEELQLANKEMEAFSYSVSHDLRAPLRAMDGFSRIVSKNYADRLDDEGRRMLDAIRSGAVRMGCLIDDLLAFSRLGRRPLEPTRIDMHAQAREVFDESAALEPGRKLRLDLHSLPEAFGTREMIRQVWTNLISNAIKFTKDREVGEIEIGARRDADGETVYYVKDNGAGFDMRYAGKLFGVFQRLHSMEEFEGTGVGLALVDRILQRHGGRIWAEAEVDRGATFFFTLPGPDK